MRTAIRLAALAAATTATLLAGAGLAYLLPPPPAADPCPHYHVDPFYPAGPGCDR